MKFVCLSLYPEFFYSKIIQNDISSATPRALQSLIIGTMDNNQSGMKKAICDMCLSLLQIAL
jgi:hypothetical protein